MFENVNMHSVNHHGRRAPCHGYDVQKPFTSEITDQAINAVINFM